MIFEFTYYALLKKRIRYIYILIIEYIILLCIESRPYELYTYIFVVVVVVRNLFLRDKLLKKTRPEDISYFIRDIPVIRFFKINFTPNIPG